MLSYRHIFHAGNHADVLKHGLLVRVIEYLQRKETPFLFVDTHAGAGLYDLLCARAQQNREFAGGIARVLSCAELPAALARYAALVRALNPPERLERYPGSPWLAARLLRPQDRARLFELHPQDFQALATLVRADRRLRAERGDGFASLAPLLPPAQRRALVLIDPPYEVKGDYASAVQALGKAWRRFPSGVYLLWYPVVRRAYADRLIRALADSGVRDVLLAELPVAGAARGGLVASGVILVNPPWTLKQELPPLLEFLAGLLACEGAGGYRLETLVGE